MKAYQLIITFLVCGLLIFGYTTFKETSNNNAEQKNSVVESSTKSQEESPMQKTVEVEENIQFVDNTSSDPNSTTTQDKCGEDPFDMANSLFNIFESTLIDIGGVAISEEKEMEIGDEMFAEIKKEYNVNDNHSQIARVRGILNKITPNVQRKKIKYKIHIIDDDKMINAFAIAGGHLHITTGLLKEVGSDDELAFIIGHEVGHVDAQHCIRKIKKIMTAQQFGDLGMIAANVSMVLTSPFGQADEYESDKYGAYYAHKAKYDPKRSHDFFSRLEKNEKYDLFGKMTRSHPYSSQRKTCLAEYIKNNLN